jgi:hypothetical protein
MAVVQQGPYIALVVDPYSLLLLRMRMRAGLKHEPIDSSENQQFPDQWHIRGGPPRADTMATRNAWMIVEVGVDARSADRSFVLMT